MSKCVVSPALVTADHVAIVMGEATNAACDVSTVAAVLRGAERGATRRLVLPARHEQALAWPAPGHKQTLAWPDQHRGSRGCRRGGWGSRPIIVVLEEEPLESHVAKAWSDNTECRKACGVFCWGGYTHGIRQTDIAVGVVGAAAVNLVRVAGLLNYHRARLHRFWSTPYTQTHRGKKRERGQNEEQVWQGVFFK